MINKKNNCKNIISSRRRGVGAYRMTPFLCAKRKKRRPMGNGTVWDHI